LPVLSTLRMAAADSAAKLLYGIADYHSPEKAKAMAEVLSVKRIRTMLMTPVEACQLLCALKAAAKVSGDVAEVGVYRGASARLLADAAADGKVLHLFDTFEGLPHEEVNLKRGQFSCGLEEVRRFVGPNAQFHKGLFPDETGADVASTRFSFVHLDMDLYPGTWAALEFFYPRLSPGGIIVCHDYHYLPGATRAMVEFFQDKAEPLIELAGHQAMIVRIGG